MINFSHINGEFQVLNKQLKLEENPIELKQRLFTHYFEQFSQIVMSLFEWENLPETMDRRALELTLFSYGSAAFYYDDTTGSFLNLSANPTNTINIYANPNEVNLFGFNGVFQKIVSIDDCVYIRNNIYATPSINTVKLFSELVTKCEQSKLVNLNTLKTPFLFRCSKKLQKTFENLYEQLESDKPMILVDDEGFNEKSFQVFNANTQYFCDKIEENKRAYIGEFLSYFGINNIEFEKKERLIVDEATSNDERLTYNILSMLRPRIEACNQFNEKYKTLLAEKGLKPISVKLSENATKFINLFDLQIDESGG